MSENKEHKKKSSRMDKLLFYSKFILILIIAVLFIIAYSFSYKDFPVSTAEYQLADHFYNTENGETSYPKVKVLVVMDYLDYYENGAYTNFYLLNNLTSNAQNLDYDLFLINNTDNYSVLSNVDESLLLRVYQNKEYQYIISIGDNAISPSKEINELFFSSCRILLYGASSTELKNTIDNIESVSENIVNTILTSKDISPAAKKMVFLCDDDEYSKTIINIINAQEEIFEDTSYEVLSSSEYSIEDACEYINNEKNASVFYISFVGSEENDAYHSDVISQIQSSTEKLIFDLSPLTEGDSVKSSIRYWSHETSDEPIAQLGIRPEYTFPLNYELIEFAIDNIVKPDTSKLSGIYTDSSAFVDWCVEQIGVEDFPKTLSAQVDFCIDNSMFIEKSDLRPGDLIFTSNKANGTIEDISGVLIYVAEEVVIGFNTKGVLCVTKPVDEKYQIAYAHPYSLLENPN